MKPEPARSERIAIVARTLGDRIDPHDAWWNDSPEDVATAIIEALDGDETTAEAERLREALDSIRWAREHPQTASLDYAHRLVQQVIDELGGGKP